MRRSWCHVCRGGSEGNGDRLIKCSTCARRFHRECCDACATNASCGAWFAKLSGAPDEIPTGSCHLYSASAASQLHSGSCPHPDGSTTVCFSENYVAPSPSPPGPPSPPPAPPSPPPAPSPRPEVVALNIATTRSWRISPWLASMSLVYVWAPDAAYENGTMARWSRASGSSPRGPQCCCPCARTEEN